MRSRRLNYRLTLPHLALVPKLLCDLKGFDIDIVPPGYFITGLMQLLMVITTERHGELIADFKAQRARLCEPQVMWIAGLPAADETRLRGDELQMDFVTNPFRFSQLQNALVDPAGGKFGLSARRERRSRRQRLWRGRSNRQLGLPSLIPEVPGDRVLMPTAIVVGWPWNRRRVIRVEADTGIGSGKLPLLLDLGVCLLIGYQSRFVGGNGWR